jgi:hypothetical protein
VKGTERRLAAGFARPIVKSRLQTGARVPGMGVNYRDETNPTEPMVVTVA